MVKNKFQKCPRCGTELRGYERRVKNIILGKDYNCWGCMTVFNWTKRNGKIFEYTKGLARNRQRPDCRG